MRSPTSCTRKSPRRPSREGRTSSAKKPFATTAEDATQGGGSPGKIRGRAFSTLRTGSSRRPCAEPRPIYRKGGIGKGFFFKGKECHNGSHSPFAKKIKFCGGGSVIHLGIHPIGYFHYLLGMPESVTGCCSGGPSSGTSCRRTSRARTGVSASCDFPGGEKVLVEGNYITTGGMDDVIEFYGSDGVIKVDLTFGARSRSSRRRDRLRGGEGGVHPGLDPSGGERDESLGYRDELAHFLACLQGREKQLAGTTAADGYNVFRIIDALYRSNRENRTVKID